MARYIEVHRADKRCTSRQCACLVVTVCIFSTTAQAQALYGSLTGNVTDASNAPLAGTKVKVTNVWTGTSTLGETNSSGVYIINYLLPGVYDVTVSANGFATFVQENVRIDVNTERRTDVQMKVAPATQTVTVNAAPSALQTDRTDIKTDLNANAVANLPLGNNRNYESLLILVPGAAPPFAIHSFAGNSTGSLGLNINGMGTFAHTTMIDGANDQSYANPDDLIYIVPQEAIDSLNIVTGGMDAEQGMAMASITTIAIKSGTNALVVGLFEIYPLLTWHVVCAKSALACKIETWSKPSNYFSALIGTASGIIGGSRC